MTKMTGAERIAKERQRQITAKGYTAEHDDQHDGGELALAAALYATPILLYEKCDYAGGITFSDPWPWPGEDGRWSPAGTNCPAPNADAPVPDCIRMLEKAGALIAAEIDRLLRCGEESTEDDPPQ